MKQILNFVMVSIITCALAFNPVSFATESTGAPDVEWVMGPNTVTVDEMAELSFSEDYVYLGKEDTVKMMEYFGNPTTEIEMGSVFPATEGQNWFIIFEYFDSGHVDDKEKDDINADDLLQSLKDGTENGNKTRKEQGMPELHIEGWLEKPAYSEDLHSLAWATLYDSNGDKGVNYESKILSREGYVAATLVCSVDEFDQAKGEFVKIVNEFKFKEGKRYSDYNPATDKISDLGLSALVLGGTAVAAKKGGLIVLLIALLKKGWILLVAAFGFIAKKLGLKKDDPEENLLPLESENDEPEKDDPENDENMTL